MTDAETALGIANQAKTMLDTAAQFAPMMGPAAPYVTAADAVANIVIGAANTVFAAHGGGKSWLDSLIETLQHLSPTQPNSPILSGPSPSAA